MGSKKVELDFSRLLGLSQVKRVAKSKTMDAKQNARLLSKIGIEEVDPVAPKGTKQARPAR